MASIQVRHRGGWRRSRPGTRLCCIGDAFRKARAATLVNSGIDPGQVMQPSRPWPAAQSLATGWRMTALISVHSPGRHGATGLRVRRDHRRFRHGVCSASYVTFEAAAAVGAGQSFVFEHGGCRRPPRSGSTRARCFAGTVISGFGMRPAPSRSSAASWDTAAYRPERRVWRRRLTLSLGGAVVQDDRVQRRLHGRELPACSESDALRQRPGVHGHHAGRSGCSTPAYYLKRQNPDVAAAGRGRRTSTSCSTAGGKGRDPSLLFSVGKYLAAYPDVARRRRSTR